MAQPGDNRSPENHTPIATDQPPFSSSEDASSLNGIGVIEELSRLRIGLESADSAYVALAQELASLRAQISHPTSTPVIPRLAPMSRISGKNTDVLRDWFDMLPTYLRAIRLNPDSAEAVLFVVSHFDNPLTKWFLAKKRLHGNSDTGGFSTIDELRSSCLEFHRGRDPAKLARDKLKQARQTSTVISYAHYLEDLFLALPSHDEGAKIHDFVFGLKPHIREAVQLHEPTSFISAVRLAQEKESAMHKGTQLPSANPSSLKSLSVKPAKSGSRYPKLTPEERQRIIDNGGCLYCRQMDHLREDCPKKKSSN